MDRLEEILSGDVRCNFRSAGFFERHHFHDVEPVHPGKEAALKGAERTIAVKKENMFFPCHDSVDGSAVSLRASTIARNSAA